MRLDAKLLAATTLARNEERTMDEDGSAAVYFLTVQVIFSDASV
jgi:hypothetical protein